MVKEHQGQPKIAQASGRVPHPWVRLKTGIIGLCKIEEGIPPACQRVYNRTRSGKVHMVACQGEDVQRYLWRARCHWYIVRRNSDYELLAAFSDQPECAKCVKHSREQRESEPPSSSDSS